MKSRAKTRTIFIYLAVLTAFLSFVDSTRAGAWLTNSPTLVIHSQASATLLQNGRVLVVAGLINGNSTNTAELFDPTTGNWRFVGSLHQSRAAHAATLLSNGKVLVAGGFYSSVQTGVTYLNSAELFDPVSETWTETGPLQTARAFFTATLLPDGRVLAASGVNNLTNTSAAELYDPATGSWARTEDLNEARSYHTATLLPNGQVMVSGGTSNGFINPGTRSSIELYDPAQGTWTVAGTLIQPRLGHTATLLPDGNVLLAGGTTNASPAIPFFSAELYDPRTGTNSPATSMHSARVYHTATLLPNGTLLVTGGITDRTGNSNFPGSATNSTEIYNPSANTWTLSAPLNTPRFAHRAVLLPSGQILAIGGATNENASSLSNTELFDSTIAPSTGSWNFTGSMVNPRANFTATLLPNGKVLVTGGLNAPDSRACELYDPITGTWTSTNPMSYGRFNHNATLLANGKVLITGNLSISPTPSEIYDPSTAIWTTNGPMASRTYGDSATLLRNGKVLVAGQTAVTAITAQLFDPVSNQWTPTAPMITPRMWHKAILLPSGKVFVVGGIQNSTDVTNAEIYDPITSQWNAAGATRASSYVFTAAALLPSGKVLVAGAATNSVSVADLYDPSNGVWSATGGPLTNHFQPNLIVLPSGKALMTGEAGVPELYDPASGKWTATPPMNIARQQDHAVLLADGRFMDIGGSEGGATAEIYDSGLYPTNTPRPQITSSAATLNLGDPLTITGTGFRGTSEGSSGNWQDSATDYPLIQLRSIESGQTTFLPATNWSKKAFSSLPVWNFPPGETLATVFVNGIQSTSSVVNIAVPIPAATTLVNPQLSTNGAFQFTFTNTPGAMLGVLASTNLALPSTNWTPLSGVTEISPGEFQFNDAQATNSKQRFYRVFSP